MVQVRLAAGWTDSVGTEHPAGAMVDVDAVTLAGLEATGVVAETAPSSQPAHLFSSSGGDSGDDTDGIPQPGGSGTTGDDTDGIPQPGGGGGGTTGGGGGTDGIPQPG